jgi:D-alanyl-D-alanine carboxypeptidase
MVTDPSKSKLRNVTVTFCRRDSAVAAAFLHAGNAVQRQTESAELCAQQMQRPARTALFISARATHQQSKKGDNADFQLYADMKNR